MTSEQINELATALAKAQGAMGGALKDSANPFFKSRYADLESVWTACRKALSENGLAVIQTVTADDAHAVITTALVHSSGQWVRDSLPLMPKDMGPQGMGSAITYGRRYALAAIVGVFQTDDDGEAAQGRIDPRGDSLQVTTAAVAKAAAQKMRDALKLGIAGRIYELHAELNREQDAYIAASSGLSAPERKAWKEAVARARVTIEDETAEAGVRG